MSLITINLILMKTKEEKDINKVEEVISAYHYIMEEHAYKWLYIPCVDNTIWLEPYIQKQEDKSTVLGVVITSGRSYITEKCVRAVR